MRFRDVTGQQEVKAHLIRQVNTGKVSHAQLFTGPEGGGKLPLAVAFARFLLCDHPLENDACGTCPSCQKTAAYTHPDIHFVYPIAVSKTDKISSSDDLRVAWNELLQQRHYFDLNTWLESTGHQGKNPIIGVEESRSIVKKLAVKPFSNKYKIVIIWLPERMNPQTANKLLKILEEPPQKTLFLLISNHTESILPTILSRTQVLRVPALGTETIADYIAVNYAIEPVAAAAIAGLSQGNLIAAIKAAEGDQAQQSYFALFVKLMRSVYAAKPTHLMDIGNELAELDRERQKNFIHYCLHLFRESIILNYMKGQLTHLREEEYQFLQKFSAFINNQNITELTATLNSAFHHIERNANAKILFTDVVIQLTKLIRKGTAA